MDTITLDAPFVSEGRAHIAFWNGRILTAEDLADEQLANHRGRRQLGRVIGPGIAEGLVVRRLDTIGQVEVSAGIALDGSGQVIELPLDVAVSLVVAPETAHGDGLFTVCQPVVSNSPTGTGAYLLVIRPATEHRSSAAGVPAFGNGIATECGPKYTVDGVSFRLVRLDPADLAQKLGHDEADVETLGDIATATSSPVVRNVLAHVLLDTWTTAVRALDPFGGDPDEIEAGAIALLRTGALLACEVPLALLTWSYTGVGFVDNWSVRRPPSNEAAFSRVQVVGSARNVHVGRASFSQFQEHLSAIVASSTAAQRAAFEIADRFRHLPAAGLIPIGRAGRPGFSPDVFGDLVVRGPATIDPARVGALVEESFRHAAIDVASGELIHLYTVNQSGSDDVDHIVFTTHRIDFVDDELVIDAVFPGGALDIGQRIEIRGRRFGFTTGDGRVRFDGHPANPRPGSSDTRLIVDVPTTLQVEPSGSDVVLTVTSNAGEDSVPVVIGHPDQRPTGTLDVTWDSVEPAVLERSKPGVLGYRVRSRVNPTSDVDLMVEGTPQAVAAARLTDADGDEITGPLRLETDEVAQVNVEFDAVPDLAAFTFRLIARVDDGGDGIVGSDRREFTTGVEIPPPDPAITLLVNDFSPQAGPPSTFDGSTVRMEHLATTDIEIVAELSEAGIYEFSVEPTSFVGPWMSVLSEPGDDIVVRTAPETHNVVVTLRRDSAADPSPSEVALVVRRAGQSADSRLTFGLEAL